MDGPTSWRDGAASQRRADLPDDWYRKDGVRAQAMQRDGWTCQWTDESGDTCGAPATDCHHIGRRDDHSLANLTALCQYHHRKITALEGVNARGTRPTARRPRQAHPGLIDPGP